MSALAHNYQIFVKPSPRRTESFLDGRHRISQGSTRAVRISTCSNSKRINSSHQKTNTLDLNSTKDSMTPLHIPKSSLNVPQTPRSSRPFTASNSTVTKQRLSSAKSNDKYNLNLTLAEDQKLHYFGPMVKKLFTPLNFKSSALSTRLFTDPFPEKPKPLITNYLIGKELGKGAYAVVKFAIHKPTNRKVAIKIYDKSKFLEPNRLKNAQREIQILQGLDHPHVMKLYESIETNEFLYLVLELITGCSLHDYLKRRPDRRLDEAEACRIFTQLMQALDYCHAQEVIHRDIKLENILLDQNNNVKLIDFGFSTNFPSTQKGKIFCGTPSYMAPEIVARIEYRGGPVDVWACAVVLFGMLCGYFPFKSQTDKECYKKIAAGLVFIPNVVAEAPRKLMEKMFITDPERRITAAGVVKDRWVKGNVEQIQVERKVDEACDQIVIVKEEGLRYNEDEVKKQMLDAKSHISLLYQQIKKNRAAESAIKRNCSNVR